MINYEILERLNKFQSKNLFMNKYANVTRRHILLYFCHIDIWSIIKCILEQIKDYYICQLFCILIYS